MKVGIPKEIYPNELRVATSPAAVLKLKKLGVDVIVQAGAGEGASMTDLAFKEAGAEIAPDAESLYAAADVVFKVRAPMTNDATGWFEGDLLKEGAGLICFIWPASSKELLEKLAARKITALAMDSVPRTTRAQKMDALSAMANIAGYRAVIEGARHFGRFLGGQSTAAGRIKPATVFIIGAGVAGLAAVAAAKNLGAIVRAFDTRPSVREQVQSLGGTFVPFEFNESGEGSGGYAKAMSESYLQAEQAMIAKECAGADIVITTALVPGKPAPELITSGAVVGMRDGSVIVDLAAEQGGNCALTDQDRVVERFGKKIIGVTNLTSLMAVQASELYAQTIFNLFEEIYKKDGDKIVPNFDDEVHRGATVTRGGEITWPPPTKPVIRDGAPMPSKSKLPPPPSVTAPPRSPWVGRLGLVAAVAVLALLGPFAPAEFLQHFTVFLLACVVGWHVVWNVSPALHTPLMSVTNAISGIIVIGGMVVMAGHGLGTTSILAGIAVLVAAINVAGGFLVTQRMLKMFRR